MRLCGKFSPITDTLGNPETFRNFVNEIELFVLGLSPTSLTNVPASRSIFLYRLQEVQ